MYKLVNFHIKLCLYLIFILKYPMNDEKEEKSQWATYCQEDFKKFPNIFNHQPICCYNFLKNINLQSDVGSNINKMFGTRKLQFGYFNKTEKIVIKHLIEDDVLQRIEGKLCEYNLKLCNRNIWSEKNQKNRIQSGLVDMFKSNKRIDGVQIFPDGSYKRFVNLYQKAAINELYLWFLFNINPEPFLLPILHKNNFHVPYIHSMCGFVFIQSYNGASLYDFYNHPFYLRCYLAKQMLEAAIQFTEGIYGFRIYLTDATPDNIVVDHRSHQVTFIDLDNIIIVDGKANESNVNLPIEWNKNHKHEKIDCDGCFAYVPDDLSKYHISDINIFAICQLLNEDLYGDKSKGFLHSIPDDIQRQYPLLEDLLKDCMNCDNRNCNNRFDKAHQLINLFDSIYSNK